MSECKLDLFCPDIRTQSEAYEAREALLNSPGADRIDVDWHSHMVRMVTMNVDCGEAALLALKNAGFPAAQP